MMHTIGKTVRIVSNWMLSIIDDGLFDRSLFEINRFSLHIKNLPSQFSDYRIVHISDIHLGTWMNEGRLLGIIDMVNELQGDIVCITGDFLTHVFDGIGATLSRGLSSLSAPDGVYAVLGNHDYWSDPELVSQVMDQQGIYLLRNQVTFIQRDQERLYLAGLDDVYNGKNQLERVISQIPPGSAAVLMVHVPDFADVSAAADRFFLELSGHSHGGQIVLPGIGRPFLPPLGRKYVQGLYQINRMHHYTNRGLGTATLPIRLNCPPEIAIFELFPA
ncbi:MAG: metallophosphoesterase [Anaerolineales bacterium]